MPAFALDLDPDGIRLFRKAGDGWDLVDTVGLDDPALPKRLRALRARAESLAGGAFETALVIPPSQILYTSVPAPPEAGHLREADIARALDGLTPCPVDEMMFDWRAEGATIRVAALDVNTLDEAEGFAVSYGFNPVRFVAWPGPDDFPDTPDFGPTQFVQHRADAAGPAAIFASHRAEAGPSGARRPEQAGAGTWVPAAPGPAPVAAPPRSAPGRPPVRTVSADRPRLSRSVLATAAAALLTFGVLIWTALYLVSPKQRPLPEVARTPELQQEEQVGEPRLAPSRRPPELAQERPTPVLPAGDDAPDVLTEMADRSSFELFAAAAPDPATEVGLLDSANIWQTPPPPLIEPAPETVDDLYLAAIDPEIDVGDAFALTPQSEDIATLDEPPLPPQPGERFEFDERGLVVATPEGALTPGGIVVTAGPPPRRPPPRKVTAVLVPDPAVALALAGKTPRPRPGDLTARMERTRFGGRTLAELGRLRPTPRPASAQEEAEQDQAEPSSPSPLAIAVSRAPSYRPTDFAAIVAAAQQARATAPETDTPVVAASAAAIAPVMPTIPSSASVARQATIENAISLRRLNLIGVYGSASDRRALLRLPSGRYVKVQVGDRIDGGQVAAIGDNELTYVKGGRNLTLKVPSS